MQQRKKSASPKSQLTELIPRWLMHTQLQFPLISSELGDNTFNQWANKCSGWLLSPPRVHVLTEKVNKITSTAIIKWHPNSITAATFWKYHTAVKINHFLVVFFLFPSTCHCCLTLWRILSKPVHQKDRLDLPHTLCLFFQGTGVSLSSLREFTLTAIFLGVKIWPLADRAIYSIFSVVPIS